MIEFKHTFRSMIQGPRGVAVLSIVLLLAVAPGCVQLPGKTPKAEVKSLQSKPATNAPITPTTLQAEVMRFADEYSMAVAQAADDFATTQGTFEARQVAARLKLGQATAAVVNAAGTSPTVNALDLVVLASVSRIVAQDYLVGQRFGEAARPLFDTVARLETNAWSMVARFLKPEQQEELRVIIDEWRRRNPDQRYVGAVRFREFAETVDTSTRSKLLSKPNSVLSLLFLDPMAGLDPTLRAVEETRYLAERAFYYGQRMPILISWQVEFLALQLADQPATRQVLTNADQVSTSLELFSRTAAQLPQLINQQRDAAIGQLFAGIATERTNLLASMAAEEGKMRALLAETRGTLTAAEQMATAVNGALQSLESFVRYVAPKKTNDLEKPAGSKGRPFDILDYGSAATQIAGMAKEINTLVASLNQSTTQATQLGQEAAANLERSMQRGFWLVVLLILLFFVAATAAALSYRVLVRKIPRDPRGGVS